MVSKKLLQKSLLSLIILLGISAAGRAQTENSKDDNLKKDNAPRMVKFKLIKSVNGKTTTIDTMIAMQDAGRLQDMFKKFNPSELERLLSNGNPIKVFDKSAFTNGFPENFKQFGLTSTWQKSAFDTTAVKGLFPAGKVMLWHATTSDTTKINGLSRTGKVTIWQGTPSDSGKSYIFLRKELQKGGEASAETNERIFKILKDNKIEIIDRDTIISRQLDLTEDKLLRNITINGQVMLDSLRGDKIIFKKQNFKRGLVDTLRVSKSATVFQLQPNGIYREVPFEKMEGTTRIPSVHRIIVLRQFNIVNTDKKDNALLKKVTPANEKKLKDLKLNDLSNYPNPSNGKFHLSFTSSKTGETTIKIFDTAGRAIYFNKFQQTSARYEKDIDISNMGSGVYLLQIIQGNSAVTKKLMVE